MFSGMASDADSEEGNGRIKDASFAPFAR